jgi:membrane protease YdiL (CAAX protease family)
MLADAIGRRRALQALLLVAPAPSIGAAFAFFVAPGPVGNAVYAAAKALLYGAPLLWLWYVEGRRGSLSPLRRGGLPFGLVSGLLIGAVVLTAYRLLPAGWIDATKIQASAAQSGFDTPARFVAIAVYLCVVNALLEEYAFRWFLYGRCRTLLARPAAILLGAALFAAHHVIVLRAFFDWPLVVLASAGVFTGGVVWTWCYERYQSVWPGYLSHALVDVAILAVGWDLLFR